MNDELVAASLAYRKNRDRILAGNPPEKYTRLLPMIPGERILEIGSAEGVLACMLARTGKTVAALERRRERHESALQLYNEWSRKHSFAAPAFFNGSIVDRLDLMKGVDTLVAIRMIYYLRDDLDTVFAAAAENVSNVVLCGNRNRSEWWRDGIPNENDRADNYYASPEGMRDVLTRHGFIVTKEVLDGDPIVIGRRG